MKKTVIIVTVLIAAVIQSYAQVGDYGIKAGVNYANIKDKGINFDLGSSYRLSYHLGIFAKFNLNKKFSLNSEVLLSNKGYKIDDNDFAYQKGEKLHLNYLNAPILFGFQPKEKLTILLGAELGYLLSANSKSDSNTTDVSDFWENKFDFGLAFGVNYPVTNKMNIGLRYTHGFSSVTNNFVIRDKYFSPRGEIFSMKNRAFQVSASYSLK